MNTKGKHFETLSIHAGGEDRNPKNALNYPIFMTSTFEFDSIEHADATFGFDTQDYVYTRGNNPTLKVLEERMAVLEGGAASVAFASGMAAITSVLMALLKPGGEVIAHRVLYGSAWNFIKNILPRYGVRSRLVDFTSIADLADQITARTKVVYFETPVNPSLEIIDIAAVCDIARSKGAKVVVDNTFATPFFQRPLELGADVVVHSATKYISGHGDVIAGITVARDEDYANELRFGYMCEFGGVMSPFTGWLLLRGLKTLALRMREHEKNALAVARYLEQHPRVKRVYYPGLPSSLGYDTAKAQMSGFGGMVSFDADGTLAQSKQVVNSMRLFKLAVSLGDCESLVEHPFTMTHRGYTEEEVAAAGLTPSMIRLSIGLEHQDDLIADLEQALSVMG
ncbi:MAG: aminotransferase class I/II-fold pyridoxal phosphate-dependent enzyme [Firmicutes bacterium]|jgi:methionine-gamma-lyase|nr:aminotransferase class I/II-fold pyridoxal phosphate-dependent enzyme [Bacillota bacterium]